MRINRRLFSVFIILLLLNGCGKQEDPESQKLLNETDTDLDTEAMSRDIVWQNNQVYSYFSEIGDGEGTIVENSSYIFYTTLEGIARINKADFSNTLILKWKEERNRWAWLCLNEYEDILYYTPNAEEVFAVDFDGGEKKKIISINMIEEKLRESKEEYLRPFIWGMHILSDKMYFSTAGGRFCFDTINKQLEYMDISDVRVSCFFEDSLIYRKRSTSGIYRFDLKTQKEEIIRGKKHFSEDEKKYGKDIKQYQYIFVFKNELYYICNDGLYKYSKDTNDILLVELSEGQSQMEYVFCKDAICYSYIEWINEDKGQFNQYLCKYDNGEQMKSVMLPDDCYQLCGVVQGTLFYKDEECEDSYKIFKID